jgi:hypothetical protein
MPKKTPTTPQIVNTIDAIDSADKLAMNEIDQLRLIVFGHFLHATTIVTMLI